ncbi:MAG: RNA polymerase sigma factor, partial [Solirubrobacteraceae bacterium]
MARRAAAGDTSALAILFEAYGAGVYAFSHRLLGAAEPAAVATQDAFLAAIEIAAEPGRPAEPFVVGVMRSARVASLELLGSRGGGPRTGTTLSAATMRLRPEQRAALALVDLAGMTHGQAAAVLEIDPGAVAPLLARARLRLRDELHGTAAAAAAVRSPDCEEALPLLAAAADGELTRPEQAWLAAHARSCEHCPRTRAAMADASATYAAWSPAAPPSWLQAATIAELEADHSLASGVAAGEPAVAEPAPRRRRHPAGAALPPSVAAAAVGGALVIAAFVLLVVVAGGPLRSGGGG